MATTNDNTTDVVTTIVSTVVARLAPAPRRTVTPEMFLIGDLSYHSLALVELSFALEELFGLLPIEMEVAQTIETVSEIQAYVHRELSAGQGCLPTFDDLAELLAAYGLADLPAEAGGEPVGDPAEGFG